MLIDEPMTQNNLNQNKDIDMIESNKNIATNQYE